MLPRQCSLGDESYIDRFGIIDLPKNVDEFCIIGGIEILPSRRVIDPGTLGDLAYLFGKAAHGDTLVVTPRPSIDGSANARVALHGFPFGAGRADTNVVGAVDQHKPPRHHMPDSPGDREKRAAAGLIARP
jgi:hypothetical protein